MRVLAIHAADNQVDLIFILLSHRGSRSDVPEHHPFFHSIDCKAVLLPAGQRMPVG